jgi:hypothetical protein
MSFAASIGHTFTGVIGHHGRVHLPPHRTTAATPATPAPESRRRAGSTANIDSAVADRQELEQWSAAFTLAVGLNR